MPCIHARIFISNTVPQVSILVTPFLIEKNLVLIILTVFTNLINPPLHNQSSIFITISSSAQMLSLIRLGSHILYHGHCCMWILFSTAWALITPCRLPLICEWPLHPTQVLTLCTGPLPWIKALLTTFGLHVPVPSVPLWMTCSPYLGSKTPLQTTPMHTCPLLYAQALTPHTRPSLGLDNLLIPPDSNTWSQAFLLPGYPLYPAWALTSHVEFLHTSFNLLTQHRDTFDAGWSTAACPKQPLFLAWTFLPSSLDFDTPYHAAPMLIFKICVFTLPLCFAAII